MDKIISCCQINLQKSKAASTELHNRSEIIALITEPSTYSKSVRNLNCLQTQVLSHEGQLLPRAVIRIDQRLHPWLVSEYTVGDMCVVAVKIESILGLVCTLYLDIKFDVKSRPFCKLVDMCNQERIPLTVGMDSNAHSPLWGCPDRKKGGGALI